VECLVETVNLLMCDKVHAPVLYSLHKSAIPLIEMYKHDVNFITVISDTACMWTLDLFQQEDHNQECLKSGTFNMHFRERKKISEKNLCSPGELFTASSIPY
jgi:hypothetical protein